MGHGIICSLIMVGSCMVGARTDAWNKRAEKEDAVPF